MPPTFQLGSYLSEFDDDFVYIHFGSALKNLVTLIFVGFGQI
jgi:hypothetical protein